MIILTQEFLMSREKLPFVDESISITYGGGFVKYVHPRVPHRVWLDWVTNSNGHLMILGQVACAVGGLTAIAQGGSTGRAVCRRDLFWTHFYIVPPNFTIGTVHPTNVIIQCAIARSRSTSNIQCRPRSSHLVCIRVSPRSPGYLHLVC